ncbi:cytochrome c oxidase subunit 3 [Pendulispora brunnea]|uniref:Cytochrome c oxidase subunit 3 n=1 Tax=Pendulispora brunnea TaxID=2905690 RepID=A0ABZ2KE74_9BACT
MSARTIDASNLPMHAFGASSPIWWGTVLFIAIESMGFALMLATYLYVRGNFDEWPPSAPFRTGPGALEVGVLLASLVPMALCWRAVRTERLLATRRWLVLATALSMAALAVRAWEIHALPFTWSENAYASVVWTTVGLHTLEIVVGAAENLFLCAVVFRRIMERKAFEDIEASCVFWFFGVLVWLPFAGLFYLDGAIR